MNIAVRQNHRRRVYHHHQHHHHRHHNQARVSAGGGIHQPEMRVSKPWLRTQKQQCRFLRCIECCFCGGVFSEVPVQQEPDPDSNGSEAEQQQRDKNAGWDEGTCRQCGACYLRSSVRPVICLCGAELCGYSFRCLADHTKSCAAQTTPQAACE